MYEIIMIESICIKSKGDESMLKRMSIGVSSLVVGATVGLATDVSAAPAEARVHFRHSPQQNPTA